MMNFNIIRNAKISLKLTVIYALMFSFVLLLLNASVLYGVKYYLYNQANSQVEDIGTIILNKIYSQSESMNSTDNGILEDVPFKEKIFIKIIGDNGKVINSSKDFNYNIQIKEPYNKIIHIEDRNRELLFKNIKIESKKYGTVYLQIVKELESEYDFLQILFIFMAIADFVGIIASIGLGYIVSRKMLKPIDYLTETAENISINNLKERIEVKGPEDELKRLGNTFNKMIDRLQESFNRQAQFVSDASHELRTPISVINGYANLLDRWGKNDKEALEKSIYAIKLEATNMANLIEKLLFLAKGDSETQGIEKKKFWLNELVNEVVEESKLIAENRIISNEKNPAVMIFADYKMIKQMIRIFIDNSIKFTGENGKIDISLERYEKHVNITINDNGIGIPKNEMQNIFDRFYTVDKSRSKDKGGTGLGLSIAKWIVDIHQGIIKVESEEEKGTKIIITLNLDK